ncbi:N-acetylneuraminate synthase [Synechococcus sp. RS9916]|uniref:N-acetylneuraminate synthase n=1 Tax=Synechococcus sp. RS9916 TaxID=221359 RepID=UPI0000E537E0|nr:N-acetylneuraminate synthase [Synechococcus sp. RS9916]EAU75550.1 putative N-acetylneuraminic acid synthetase [Synechococcus sp. RS9916]
MVLIIAEAGVNHNGSVKMAKELIDAASSAGADVVKFQTFKASSLVTNYASKATYQQTNTDPLESQLNMLKSLELSEDDHYSLIDYCQSKGIVFLSTAFDLLSIDFLRKTHPVFWKIPSGEITNLPYLRSIGSFNMPVLLSTGMCTLGDIETAINILENAGTSRSNITVLHCTTEYPAPFDEVNLNSIPAIAKAFGTSVGYSDHTTGISVPIAAVALGATVIEKHLTLNRSLPGPDHKASLEPSEFAAMVDGIRSVVSSLGDGIKRPTSSETKNLIIARKSIVAATPIKVGDRFTSSNLTTKRPGSGISPIYWDSLLGKSSTRDYMPDDLIYWL